MNNNDGWIECNLPFYNLEDPPSEYFDALGDFDKLYDYLYDEIDKEAYAIFGKDTNSAEYDNWYNERVSNDPNISEYLKKRDELRAFLSKEYGRNFCDCGLCKAGTLIEVEVNGKLKIYLIGHINECGSPGDDGVAFYGQTAIVKRYKIIWKENLNNGV